MQRFLGYACLAMTGALACGSVLAAQSLTKSTVRPANTPSTVVFQGVQVAIDPATGRLRAPTDAERRALTRAMLQREAAAAVTPRAAGQRPRTAAEAQLTLRRHTGGRVGMSMQVPDNQFDYLTAERKDDGRIAIHHQSDSQPAAAVEVAQ